MLVLPVLGMSVLLLLVPLGSSVFIAVARPLLFLPPYLLLPFFASPFLGSVGLEVCIERGLVAGLGAVAAEVCSSTVEAWSGGWFTATSSCAENGLVGLSG